MDVGDHERSLVSDPPADRRARLVLIVTIAAILGGIAVMASFGRYAMIWKAVVVPILLIGALLTRRFHRFVNDWALFLAFVVLFDFVRGFVFSIITHYQLPVYMGYAIEWERMLLGGTTFPELLQTWRTSLADPALLDRVLTIVHGSHFVFFLVFGMAVWLLRPEGFRRYTVTVVAVLFAGALGYLLVPTIPPWMAAESFGVISPVDSIVVRIYNAQLPTLQQALDTNPIAAMPSLHAALPTLCTLIAVNLFGGWGIPIGAYALLVYFASGYLGQHYLVDLLAGGALAIGGFVGIRVLGGGARSVSRGAPKARPVLVAGLVIVLAQGIGYATNAIQKPLVVTREFATRELLGRTPLAHVFLGSDAFQTGNWPEARRHFARASAELSDSRGRLHAQVWLARAAFRQGDHGHVIAVLEPVRQDIDPASVMMLGASYLEAGRRQEGLDLLHALKQRFPNEPEPVYWLARDRFLHHELSEGELRQVAESLEPHGDGATHFRRSLLELLPTRAN